MCPLSTAKMLWENLLTKLVVVSTISIARTFTISITQDYHLIYSLLVIEKSLTLVNSFNNRAVPDDFLECAGNSTNNSGAALQVYGIGLIIIALIGTYIY